MSRMRWMKFWPADWQRDPALRMCSLAARGLWIEMIALAHDAEPYGHVLVNGTAPTPKQLAAIVGSTEREVAKLLAELETAGVFSRAEGGGIVSRRMVRDHEASQQGREHVARRWANSPPKSDPITPPNRVSGRGANTLEAEAEKEAEAEEETPHTPRAGGLVRRADRSGDFEDFWQAYPRKVGKDAARKAFAAALKRASIAEIAAGLNQARWPAEPRFIPHPATWLNQGRWQDNPDDAAPEPAGKLDWMAEFFSGGRMQ